MSTTRRLCLGLPDTELSQRVVALRDRVLRTLPGNWRLKAMDYYCGIAECDGSHSDLRKRAAVQHVVAVLTELIFRCKVPIPVLSRWWKVMVCARKHYWA